MHLNEELITLYGISCDKAEGIVCVNHCDEAAEKLNQLYIEKKEKRDKLRDKLGGVLTNLEIKYQRHELSEDEELIRQAWDSMNSSINEMETVL